MLILGNTALHLACQMDRHREVPMLLQSGANINIRNKLGKLPIDVIEKKQENKEMLIAAMIKATTGKKKTNINNLYFVLNVHKQHMHIYKKLCY